MTRRSQAAAGKGTGWGMKPVLERFLLWFSDLAQIVFRPGGAALQTAISRNRKFEQVLPLFLAVVILAHLIGLGRGSIQTVFANFVLSALLLPALLIVHGWALRLVIRDPGRTARNQEAFFHLDALAASAGILAGSLLAYLSALLGVVLAIPVFLYLFAAILVSGLRLLLGIPFGRAMAIQSAGLLLTVPLFVLCLAFYLLLPGAIKILYH
jgi:hypothetical protein